MKHEYETTVTFRRKTIEEGDVVKLAGLPADTSMYTSHELNSLKLSIGKTFVVVAGDEYGAMIQLFDVAAPTWVDKDGLLRTA